MKLSKQKVIFLCAALVAGLLIIQRHSSPHAFKALPFSEKLIQRQITRMKLSRMQQLINTLGIKDGMVILDIGTGSGQYAYQFSKALHGTGKIFATDVNPEMIGYVRAEIKKRKLSNIEPVLVTAQGVDPFYGRNKYDLIFIAHTDIYISDFKNYVRTLKNYLTPGGRFVILRKKAIPAFMLKDITNIKGLLTEIVNERPNSPFYKYLGRLQLPARQALASNNIPQQLKKDLVRCLNNLVFKDIYFYENFLRKDLPKNKEDFFKTDLALTSDEKGYLQEAMSGMDEGNLLDQRGALDPKKKDTRYYFLSKFSVLKINQTLLIQRFRPYLYNGHSPYLPGGEISAETKNIENTFIQTGYTIAGEYDFIPYDLLFIFST